MSSPLKKICFDPHTIFTHPYTKQKRFHLVYIIHLADLPPMSYRNNKKMSLNYFLIMMVALVSTPTSLILIKNRKFASYSRLQPSLSCRLSPKKSFLPTTSKKKNLSYLSSCKYATIPAAIITHPIEKHKTCFLHQSHIFKPSMGYLKLPEITHALHLQGKSLTSLFIGVIHIESSIDNHI